MIKDHTVNMYTDQYIKIPRREILPQFFDYILTLYIPGSLFFLLFCNFFTIGTGKIWFRSIRIDCNDAEGNFVCEPGNYEKRILVVCGSFLYNVPR